MQGNEFYIFLLLASVYGLFILLKDKKNPPTETFTCARCNKQEKYSPRTINAWRRGYDRLYCYTCHSQWLKDHPFRQTAADTRGGCLSVFIIVVLVPPTIYSVAKLFF
ncbi:hypothetical protein [Teredinibacter sp. KSP-S5-2]|uniref:hypothetical protein n=1 Tax=Teredinibacter sp. KSP-S5-2 TaxID=3034506 RepID=UPI002934CB3B|nr:hypothetical protein [Teredinibacter sp. KSP-S5-2]WNO07800.1 hypothetical protein P5V12_12450 [Teredinibacter sp. KSP-S5-2]